VKFVVPVPEALIVYWPVNGVPDAPNCAAPRLGVEGLATPSISSGTWAFTFLPDADKALTDV
jgi:hypothetical protein